ncbi:hypothetical protein ACFWJS_33755 [Streptomyces sp. NPDC127061]|uniref:hypothetical protein n=1 Tax=Streptomyces sp. NPDC127061 TaxID=3347122 RepID=UPI0036573872
MPIYNAYRTDHVDYDEHSEVTLRAASEEAARAMVVGVADGASHSDVRLQGFRADGSNWKLVPVPTRGPAEFITASFHAG